MFRRILIIALSVLFAVVWTSPVPAVEKKTRSDKSKKTKVVQQDSAKNTAKGSNSTASTPTKTGGSKKTGGGTSTGTQAQNRFDTFVDQNKNGIDDRRENLKTKAIVNQQEEARKAAADKAKAEAEKARQEAQKKAEADRQAAAKKADSTKKAPDKK